MTSLSRTLSVVFAPSTALFLATRTGFRSPTARTHLSHAARRSVAAMADPASAATAEPRTGFHTAPDELIQEALGKFFDDPHKCTVTSTKGGVNNVVQYVSTPEGERFILRIYNNGRKSEKVVYEHEILRQLNEMPPLSFQVPKALPSRSGRSHELLSDGSEACVFYVIPGSLARTTTPREVGRAAGELCSAMAKVKVDMEGPIAPYYELYRVHHAVNRDIFLEDMASPLMDGCRNAAEVLLAELRVIEERLLSRSAEIDLPKQTIHGDLHYDNVMATEDDIVSGVLDFEFCACDWRAMELAVCLSKYVGEEDPLPLCIEFINGFIENTELTPAEIEVIPDCINLRILSNAVYFVGRARAGEDSIESLTTRADAYAKRVQWVRANADAIVDALREAITAKNA